MDKESLKEKFEKGIIFIMLFVSFLMVIKLQNNLSLKNIMTRFVVYGFIVAMSAFILHDFFIPYKA